MNGSKPVCFMFQLVNLPLVGYDKFITVLSAFLLSVNSAHTDKKAKEGFCSEMMFLLHWTGIQKNYPYANMPWHSGTWLVYSGKLGAISSPYRKIDYIKS